MSNHDEIELVPEIEGSVEIESEPLYCFCRMPWDKNTRRFMIQCDHCKEWFHGECVGVKEQTSLALEKYHCPKCEPTVGVSVYKTPDHRPLQAGTSTFVQKLKEKTFSNAEEVLLRLRGQALTLPYLILKGFSRPIVVEDKEGLDLIVPSENFTVRDVEKYVGSDRMLDVIDVRKQCDIKMTMKEFSDYFTHPVRKELYNLISLEFSKTDLSRIVLSPDIARKLDWANLWPMGLDEEIAQKPQVSKYCLISPKDSYTDFHVDFGGTSVWYHILWGEKIFYLIEPTPTNLALYQNWMSSTVQYETFLADTVDFCYRCVLKKGQTLFIPTGWIHAVLTPEDSLVFGGNFLHSLNMETQLRIYEIEKKLNVPSKYLFPSFEATHWFAAEKVVADIQSLNSAGVVPPHLYFGSVALLQALRIWHDEKEIGSLRREGLPPNINIHRLLANLKREVRITDRRFQPNASKVEKSVKKKSVPKENGSGVKKSEKSSDSSPNSSGEPVAQRVPPVKLLISGLSILSSEIKTSVSSSSSPPSHGNAPIKLKLKKQSSQCSSRQSSPPYTTTSSSINDVASNYHLTCGPVSPDGLKLRLSLYSPKTDSAEISSNCGSDTLYIVDDEVGAVDSGEEKRRNAKLEGAKKKKYKNHHHKQREENLALDAELAGTLSGINELITSSNYTQRVAAAHEGASASMKEAVAELLHSENLPLKTRLGRGGNKRKRAADDMYDEEYIDKVHQDKDFIYLPLTGGSDDEMMPEKRRGRKKKSSQNIDEPWSPRFKVNSSSVGKRSEVPKRVDAKVEAVEKGLEKAAGMVSKVHKPKPATLKSSKHSSMKGKLTTDASTSQTKSKSLLGPKPTVSSSSTSTAQKIGIPKKLKKGMATPKQRLGRILKLNKLTKF